MSDNGSWCLIESDPGVFTELIREFGCKGVQVEELYSLDKSLFANFKPIYGLIFLFKWVKDDETTGSIVADSRLEDIFFAKQVISNACASQAILSVLLNTNSSDVELGPTLTEFKEFCQSFDAQMKGLTLSNSDKIRSVHNSFSPNALFEFDSKIPNKDDDVYHFVGYLPINGRVYELDGLKEGPIDHGAIPPQADWLDVVTPIIEKRMQKYNEGEIHFNLMAIVADLKSKYEKQLKEILTEMEDSPSSEKSDQLLKEISRLKLLIDQEDAKMTSFKIENIRRKHNYLPLIMEILKLLAREKKLIPLYEDARKRALTRSTKK